jgi:cell division protein FtsA
VGVEVNNFVHRTLASAFAVLDADQRELGALVIDLGAGTTSYVVLAGDNSPNSPKWGVSDVGGDNITSDISRCLNIPNAAAEKLKRDWRQVWLGLPPPGERAAIENETGIDRKEVDCKMLNMIVRRRVLDTFHRMKIHLEGNGVQIGSLAAGVHLTGGGSMLPGIDDLAQELFGIPAHLTRAKGITWEASALESPEYSCAIGLLKYGPK